MKKLNNLLNMEEKIDILLPLCEDMADNGYFVLDKANQPEVMILNGLTFAPNKSIAGIVFEALNEEKRVIRAVYSCELELKEILVSLPNVDTNVEYTMHQYTPALHLIESGRKRINEPQKSELQLLCDTMAQCFAIGDKIFD
ncbi:hypothetical protein COM82_29655 [Bacillus thuringiensis]|uniref:hypothetical protein n=1 Tax=Bacillus thuringiensis TaxID=1428 RepID=UPI000BEBEB91|nr:hypothetical protein [Bacillus thuringiensis]PEB44175.1 hypothetical protein COM82_29655 [Bacillus thuringiensis]